MVDGVGDFGRTWTLDAAPDTMDRMAEPPTWLDDVIIVNESDDPAVAGDVQIYRNEGDLGRDLEAWYVADVPHLALTGSGQKATLGVRDRRVVVERVEPFAGGPGLVTSWLEASARRLHAVRAERELKGKAHLGKLERRGVLPASTEGLLAYIGFDH